MPLWIRRIFEILGFAALYFGLGRLGLTIGAVSGFATLVWPPTGISLALLLLVGYRLSPGILLGAFLVNASVGAPLLAALSIGTGNMLEAVAAVYLLRAFGFRNSFERLQDVLGFVIFGVLVSTIVSATAGVATLSAAGLVPASNAAYTWIAWWVGDALGALVLCPLILAWFPARGPVLPFPRFLEAIFLVVILIGAAAFNFGDWFGPALGRYFRPYCIFPVLIWASLRFEQRGATSSTFLLLIIAVWFTAAGAGPFTSVSLSDRLISLQMFMGVLTLTTLTLAAASAERRVALDSVRTGRDELEERVRLRTLELTEANKMLSEAQAQAHIGSWSWDVLYDKITWSDELYAIFGLDPRGFAGTYESFLRSVHPDDRHMIKQGIEESLRTGEPFAHDHRIIRPDGTVRVVHGEGAVFKSPAGEVLRLAGTAQDITERTLLEGKFRELLESAPDAMLIVDRAGRISLVNSQTERLFGFAREQLLGRDFELLLPERFRAKHAEHRRAYVSDPHVRPMGVGMELFGLRKDGSEIPVEISLSPSQSDNGVLVIAAIRDITERKKTELEIKLLNEQLEQRVRERTAELEVVNKAFAEEIQERIEAQQLLQGIIDNSPAVVYVKDTDGRYLLVNRRFGELFHVSGKAVVGKTDQDLFPAPMARQFRVNDLEVLRSGGALEKEETAPHDDGPHTYISLKVPLYNESGSPFAICGISTDITDRKHAEEETSRSRERYRGFFENSPISLWEEDFSEVKAEIDRLRQEGVSDFRTYFSSHPEAVADCAAKVRVVEVNKATLRMYEAGSTSDFFAGLRKVLSRDSYDVFREELVAIAGGLTEFESEDINTTSLGKRIDIYLKWSVGPGNERTYSRVLVSIIDITERKRIEKQIRLLAQALESTTEMICITNLENRIIFANKAFLGAYGYSEKEILGADPAILRSPRNPAEISAQIFEHTRSEGWTGELLNRKKDGKEFPVYLNTSRILDTDGTLLGLIGVARDISDIRKAEDVLWEAASKIERLFEASAELPPVPVKNHDPYSTDPAKRKHDLARDISEVIGMLRTRAQQTLSFSSLASHQLRTPLTILRSQLENALRPDLSAAALRKTLSSTYDEILHLSHVVDVLLSLSRMQAGTARPAVQEIDFYHLLKEFHRESLLLAREKKISVVFEKGPRASIHADPEQIRQVLLNLLDNAIKYTPVRGRIGFMYTVGESELLFQIENSGDGIAPGTLPHIFDPFRSGESEKSAEQGTGLGLALAKWIVESHRGTIEARSIPGEKTTFSIRLPVGTPSRE